MVRESETVRFRGEQCYQVFEGSLPLHISLIVNFHPDFCITQQASFDCKKVITSIHAQPAMSALPVR